MTLVIIWLAVLTICVFIQFKTISEINDENESMHYCMKTLIKAWQVHNRKVADGIWERREP